MTTSPADWMTIGVITSAHGVHGDLRVRPETDFPERFEEAESLTLLLPSPWPPPAVAEPVAPVLAPPRQVPSLPARGGARTVGRRKTGPAGSGAPASPPPQASPPPPRPRTARAFPVEEVRSHKGGFLIKLEGVDDRDLADTLRGVEIVIRRDELRPLPEGTWYVYQLEGLQVHDENGVHLGVLDEVLFTGGNDVYVVKGEREILLPAIKQVIKSVDLAAGRMVVHLLEGL